MTLQPSQPLLRIFNFRDAGIGVFPEVEEFFELIFSQLPNPLPINHFCSL